MTKLEQLIEHLEHHVELKDWDICDHSKCVIGHAEILFGLQRGRVHQAVFGDSAYTPEYYNLCYRCLLPGYYWPVDDQTWKGEDQTWREDFPTPQSAAAYMREHFLPKGGAQ
jgi:hypothetical protein